MIRAPAQGTKHLLGKLTFPGGRINANDTSPASAAARELLEETGLQVDPKDVREVALRSGEDFESHHVLGHYGHFVRATAAR